MVKIFIKLRRSSVISLEEFADYYCNRYAPLVLDCETALTGFSTNMVDKQSLLSLNVGRDSRELPFDGLTAFYFENIEGFLDPERRYASKSAERRIRENFGQFIGQSHAYLVEEFVQWDRLEPQTEGTPSLGFRVIAMSRRASKISKDDFIDHYLNVHTELAREHHPGISRYVQNFVMKKLTPDAPPLDAIAELHFTSDDDFTERFYATPESRQIIWDDVKKFADLKTVRFVTAVETVWKRPVFYT